LQRHNTFLPAVNDGQPLYHLEVVLVIDHGIAVQGGVYVEYAVMLAHFQRNVLVVAAYFYVPGLLAYNHYIPAGNHVVRRHPLIYFVGYQSV